MAKQVKFIKAFATHLDKLRRERQLSFQKMADLCDMEKSRVYKICTEGVDIKASTIIKIAKGLNLSVAELLNFKH